MQEDLFKIFGLTSNASDEEVDEQYKKLRQKYRNDMFLEGDEGNRAAKKLTELENAYSDVLSERSYKVYSSVDGNVNASDSTYTKVEELVKGGQINEAQAILDNIKVRNGEWHYYQAMVYYKKDWFTDSKKHLELAIEAEPNNTKYKTALTRLEKLMSGEDKKTEKKEKKTAEEWFNEERKKANDDSPDWEDNNRQMGGCDDTMNCCTQLLCANLICNCLGGGC